MAVNENNPKKGSPASIKAWADRKRAEATLSDADKAQIRDEAEYRKGYN
jgi:hypothetical protein